MRPRALLCPFVPFLSRPAAHWGRGAGDRRLTGRFSLALWPLAQKAKRGRSPTHAPDTDQLPVKVASHPIACAASTPPPAPSKIALTLPATAPITGHLGLGEAA